MERLKASGRWKLVLASKGDLQEQMDKLKASGLESYFDHIQIMVEKDVLNYRRLCQTMNCRPEELLMVGNSFKSDIAPVVNIGGWAIHTPHDVVWVHEMMDMPESERIIEVKNITEILKYL